MNELFFPDDDNIKFYTSLIKSQGLNVCRQQISRIWIDTSIADCSFGIANYSTRAQKRTKRILHGFILCRIDIKDPEILWIDMVCASETSKLGLLLMQEAEKNAIKNKVIRRLALFSLAEKKLVNWYTKQGFVNNSVRFMDTVTKAYLMMKPLYNLYNLTT